MISRTAIAIGDNGGGDRLVFCFHARTALRSWSRVLVDHATGELISVADDFGDLE